MLTVEVIAFGRAGCRKTYRLIDATSHDLDTAIVLEKAGGGVRTAIES